MTELSSVPHEGRPEEIRGAAEEMPHVRSEPARIVVPHTGPALLPQAATTVLLSRAVQDPLGTL
ncbi:hypothetical protein ACFCZ1_05860 [Streptomyces sp. NPDC056224]|uniref:hypothetical protein n=1 Tax=Streptomyces sp. NPDC056224 TaxID=3345750 RepID=UPI0035E2697D